MHQFGDFRYTVLSGDQELNRKASALVDAMGNQYYGLTGMAEILIQHEILTFSTSTAMVGKC